MRQSFTCLQKISINQKLMTLIIIRNDKNLQKFFANIIKKFFANIFAKLSANKQSSIDVIKKNFIAVSLFVEPFIKHSKIDFDFDLKTKYDFKKWNHVKIEITFSKTAKSRIKCLNIDTEFTIIDRFFLKK